MDLSKYKAVIPGFEGLSNHCWLLYFGLKFLSDMHLLPVKKINIINKLSV
jgi:hypothetical protein